MNALRKVGFMTVEQYVNYKIELSHREAPNKCAPGKSRYGWILPNGDFFPCEWAEHDWLAEVLGKTAVEAEVAGWLRVGFDTMGHNAYIQSEDLQLAQRQLDTLSDWCLAHEVELPGWAIE